MERQRYCIENDSWSLHMDIELMKEAEKLFLIIIIVEFKDQIWQKLKTWYYL